MKNNTKLYVKDKRDSLAELCSQSILEADRSDLSVLSMILLARDADGKVEIGTDELSRMLGMSEDAVRAAIKFWRGAGVLSSTPSSPDPQKKKTAHRNGALESNPEIDYSTGELVSLIEKKRVTSEFIDEAQRILGKTFNAYDSNIAAGLLDRFEFEPEALLAILAYCSESGKRTMRYVEKLAISFYDEGITTSDAVYDKIRKIERSGIVTEQIKKLYGVGGRELSGTEKKLFDRWSSVYGYDIEIIRRAYDITIDNAHEPAPKYTDGVLNNWYSAGLKTLEDIDRYEEQRRGERAAVKTRAPRAAKKVEPEREKSYDIDAFFEASLARGFEDVDKK